ncbi:GNAT family N-acetyltransferase [Aquabacterium humicola]|uniref:GNAT family N-acetyltransferase n=1 Tax=Aquabacterium humicola TaxID=3237377 RepID=UPI0025437884|nr:GNAT family N-acetyltransferase [Rubrivivax pictus]
MSTSPPAAARPALKVQRLTSARFDDLQALFAARGCSVARNCWCMYYRWSGHPPPGRRAEVSRSAFKALLDEGRHMGLIAYAGREPVGWLSVGPREDYAKLARSPVMKPVDEQPVWSVVCFVVAGRWRGQGVAKALLDAAVERARRKKITLEAYPVDKPVRQDDDNLWFGPKSMFDACGFDEVARRKPTRPVVRLVPG